MSRSLLFAALLLLTAPARAGWMNNGQTEVPLEGSGTAWYVRANIDGTPGLFLVDTGASICVLTPATADRAGVRKSSERVEVHTANGPVKAPLVSVKNVEVGRTRVRDVQAIVYQAVPAPIDGIIGLSFLNHFSYAIDPERRVLRLAER
jgi:clan AA aspartic protease (TIGR02281 family)